MSDTEMARLRADIQKLQEMLSSIGDIQHKQDKDMVLLSAKMETMSSKIEAVDVKVDGIWSGIGRGLWIAGGALIAGATSWIMGGGLDPKP